MTVKELKDILEKMPDDAEVNAVDSGIEYGYPITHVKQCESIIYKDGIVQICFKY